MSTYRLYIYSASNSGNDSVEFTVVVFGQVNKVGDDFFGAVHIEFRR
jgi:hypothetical protein